ncbi:LysR family transcriptional regulator [Muricauda sp. CAU 1633]|uniref:LysR family transcriptional regulator n=1 Tax=Allomuricauda sp. CAU 1633 TaxID=2816036 RepID=UPI001A8E988B|nr:LysR family transcriptional regulator [Muricauda sp. CAU 1633]MBO0323140.1 LysR family transcriptional regulator [Muricauda sp. CAU 1633]
MQLRHIHYFLTLAEELHFRRAAEKLFIAQPALTRQIKDLEEQLGTVLFKRDKRNVSLTPSGKFLQQEGYQLLKKVEMIKSSIADMGSTLTGAITIGCIGSAMTHILPNLIHEMAGKFPKMKVNIVETTTLNLVNQLLDGQIDIMIGRPHKEMAHVHSENIFTDTTLLAIASNSKWNITESSKVSELKDVPFLLFPRAAGTFFRDEIISTCGRHGFSPQIQHESINAFSLLKLVEKDIGVSLMPKSITQGYNLQVNYLEIDELNIPLDMVVSYRTDLKDELPRTIAQIIKRHLAEGAN